MAKDKKRKILTEDEIDIEILKEQKQISDEKEKQELLSGLKTDELSDDEKEFLVAQHTKPKKIKKEESKVWNKIKHFFKSINWIIVTAITIPCIVVGLVVTNIVTGGFGDGTKYYDSWKGQGKYVNFKERHITSVETFYVMDDPKWEEYTSTPQYLVFVYQYNDPACEGMKRQILKYIDTCDFLIFLTRETSDYHISTAETEDDRYKEAYASIGAKKAENITIGTFPTLICISNGDESERAVTSIYSGVEQIDLILQSNPS